LKQPLIIKNLEKLTNQIQKIIAEDWIDLLLDNDNIVVDIYKDLLLKSQQPMLEINCGTGRISFEILKENIDIECHDENNNFILKATEKFEKNGLITKFHHQKLINLNLSKNFNTIFVAGNSFLLIDNSEDALVVLKKIYHYLNNGGKFIIDIYTPWKQILSNQENLWKIGRSAVNKENSQKLVVYYSEKFDLLNQFRTLYSKYELYKNDILVNTIFEETKLKWYSVNEFKLMLEKVGFSKIEILNKQIYSHLENSSLFIASKLE
jgi:ubiquinone/menaquinone biosynthesis C-methylase UbiE